MLRKVGPSSTSTGSAEAKSGPLRWADDVDLIRFGSSPSMKRRLGWCTLMPSMGAETED